MSIVEVENFSTSKDLSAEILPNRDLVQDNLEKDYILTMGLMLKTSLAVCLTELKC
jgi:hypothetical protein